MRSLYGLDPWRDTKAALAFYGHPGDETCGMFTFISRVDSKPMRVIASSGDGWDHVSVSRQDRVPCYQEMEHIARLFFNPDEYAVQYHVPRSEHVNCHPHCLHWWRPTDVELPRPPSSMVGPK